MNTVGQKVKATVQKQIVTGVIVPTKTHKEGYCRTQTMETKDNPEPENVLLYRVKFDTIVNVLCDDVIKPFTEMWVDSKMVVAL